MFGRKKRAAAVPDSRFCIRPAEVPYAWLYRYDHFVLALSKLSLQSEWSSGSLSGETAAYGLLHGSHTFPDRGTEEPLLPVEVTFGEDTYHPDSLGLASLERTSDDGPFVLYVGINDPDGSIATAFATAMQHAIISGRSFLHLRCVKSRSYERPLRTDYALQFKEDQEFLKRVESGDAEFEQITFDRIFFDDQLITKAQQWSWDWTAFEFEQARFKSKATAKWRRESLPHRLK
jgi:hypothetical protein